MPNYDFETPSALPHKRPFLFFLVNRGEGGQVTITLSSLLVDFRAPSLFPARCQIKSLQELKDFKGGPCNVNLFNGFLEYKTGGLDVLVSFLDNRANEVKELILFSKPLVSH